DARRLVPARPEDFRRTVERLVDVELPRAGHGHPNLTPRFPAGSIGYVDFMERTFQNSHPRPRIRFQGLPLRPDHLGARRAMKRFESKVVLVLGGNAGIGRATAVAFAREGAKVVVAARREDQGVAVVQAIQKEGGTANFVRADVAKEADIKAVIDSTVNEFGQLDVLFNNAGIEGKNGPISTLGAADF